MLTAGEVIGTVNGVADGVDFAQIERDHVRNRLYPDFTWRAHDAFSPLNPLPRPLSEARVAVVTTAGAHHRSDRPFDTNAAAGDPSFRSFPSDTPLAELALSHGGYDTRRAGQDPNVVLPLDALRAAVRDGQIGELAPTVYAFMGYVADTAPLVRDTGPAVARRLREDGADLVLLVPT